MSVRLTFEPFDPGALLTAFAQGREETGAIATFTGIARAEAGSTVALELEAYPGFTENHIARTADLAKVRGLSAAWKDNEIGRRMMAAIENSKPLTEAELPPRTPRGAPLGKEGALVADLLKLLLKIRSREIDVAARLLARSTETPEALRDKVTSPNGTTYAGLQVMAARQFREMLKETVLAGTRRAGELSRD